jgi:hypothetical protein
MSARPSATASESPWSLVRQPCWRATGVDVGRKPFISTGRLGSTARTAATSAAANALASRQECSRPSGSTASCSTCQATIPARSR